MKKDEEYEGYVREVDFPNKGRVETEVGVITCKNAIPDSKVLVRVLKVRKGKAEGTILKVLEQSKDAVTAQCPHFGICGGCTYLTMPYDKECAMKEAQVLKLLNTVVPKDSFTWDGIHKSPIYEGYRNKMEFSFGDEYKDGPLSLGMHRRGSFYDVVLTDHCYICDEDYRTILAATQNYFKDSGLKFFHKLRHDGYLRHLLVRKAKHTGEIMVALVTTSESNFDLTEYKELLLSLSLDGKIVSILHTINDSVSDVVQSDRTDILYGRDYIEETLLGLTFHISEFSFFQTNSLGAEVLYQTVCDFIGNLSNKEMSDKTVFDLYSGTGTISQLVSKVSKKVIGVEIVEEAVAAAKENAKLNKIDNCEFIAGDVLKVLDDVDEKPDFIILDPPRDGIHPKALPKILNYNVDHIVYISCKLSSLVRDLETIQAYGYKVTRAACVEQFPWTANVETIALIERVSNRKPDKVVEIGVDVEDYYKIKNE